MKKRLVNEGYDKKERQAYSDLIWAWIKSATLEGLEKNRENLLKELRIKDQDYILNCYGPQEHRFIRAYSRKMANLGCNTTQRAEGYHILTKSTINRHTSMVKAVQKLAKDVKQMAIDFERDVSLQRCHLPRILELDPPPFMSIRDLVTHECLQMIVPKWIKTKKNGHNVFFRERRTSRRRMSL